MCWKQAHRNWTMWYAFVIATGGKAQARPDKNFTTEVTEFAENCEILFHHKEHQGHQGYLHSKSLNSRTFWSPIATFEVAVLRALRGESGFPRPAARIQSQFSVNSVNSVVKSITTEVTEFTENCEILFHHKEHQGH